jgi:hypothetical protein
MRACDERNAKAKRTRDEPMNLKSTTLIISDWLQHWYCLESCESRGLSQCDGRTDKRHCVIAEASNATFRVQSGLSSSRIPPYVQCYSLSYFRLTGTAGNSRTRWKLRGMSHLRFHLIHSYNNKVDATTLDQQRTKLRSCRKVKFKLSLCFTS